MAWFKSQGWLKEDEGVSEALTRSMFRNGCLGDRAVHWSADCWILECCVDGKGLESCSSCESFPCESLMTWSQQNASYGQALERLRAIRSQRQPGGSHG